MPRLRRLPETAAGCWKQRAGKCSPTARGRKRIMTRRSSEIAAFLASCRRIFWGSAAFSGLSNILMLTGSFFMLQVYDRVLPGRSIPTLIALMALAMVLYVFQGALDLIRNRISVRIGRHLDETLGLRVFDAMVRLPLKTRGDGDGLQPLRDLDQVRSFLSSGGPRALFDLPWMPIYLGICFLFHFWIGVTALVGALVLVAITLLTETRTRGPAKASCPLCRGAQRARSRRAGETPKCCRPWACAGRRRCAGGSSTRSTLRRTRPPAMSPAVSADFEGLPCVSAVARSRRRRLSRHQSGIDGRHHHRRFDPDRARAGARRTGDRELEGIRRSPPVRPPAGPALEALAQGRGASGAAAADRNASRSKHINVTAPGSEKLILNDVSFSLRQGEGLGIIGPSGSGKSTLARALVGVWPQLRGKNQARQRRRWISGPRKRSADTSAICRRMSNCSTAASPSISRASIRRPRRRRCWRRLERLARTISFFRSPMDTVPRSARAEWRCRPASVSASDLRARSTAIRSWSCSTSRHRISIQRARRRLPRRS